MTDVRVRELFESALDAAPPARFDLDSAVRAGRRRHRVRTGAVLGSSALAVVLAGTLAFAVLPGTDVGPAPADPVAGAPAAVALPRGVVAVGASAYAVPVLPRSTRGSFTEKAPVLEVWVDPQCPACSSLHAAVAATIDALVDEGMTDAYYRPATFIDTRVADQNASAGAPRSSRRAVAAWGCAIDAGRGREYLDALMSGQPTQEGRGFTDARLLELGRSAGISGAGLAAFSSCLADGRYLAWADAAQGEVASAGVAGAPTVVLDGRVLPIAVAVDPVALRAAVLEAAATTR